MAFFNSKYFIRITILLLFLFISIIHLWKIDSHPRGLYLDEMAIGYNSYEISNSGKDEYGNILPVYFRSFEDYKSPVYFYAQAVIFKVFGVSEFTLRFTSFFFFFLSILGFFFLIKKLFPDKKVVWLYALISFGFLPYFFPVSRVTFELNAQLTFIIWTSYFLLKTFEKTNTSNAIKNPIASGLLLGTSIYTYATSRLLSPLYSIASLVFFRVKDIRKFSIFVVSGLITLIPFVIYYLTHPDTLTGRFSQISYFSGNLPLTNKLFIFIQNYLSHFSFEYLLLNGDANIRHHTQFGGMVFVIVYILWLIGIVSFFINSDLRKNKFYIFMMLGMLIAPIASSLTSDGVPHALRSLTLGFFILFFSCVGFQQLYIYIEQTPVKRYFFLYTAGVFTLLLIQSGLYTYNYFHSYPLKTIAAFETYGLKESYKVAVDQKPDMIIMPFGYARVAQGFYNQVIQGAKDIPVKEGSLAEGEGKFCIIDTASNTKDYPDGDIFNGINDKSFRINTKCYSR